MSEYESLRRHVFFNLWMVNGREGIGTSTSLKPFLGTYSWVKRVLIDGLLEEPGI